MFSGGVDKVIYDLSGNLIDLISIFWCVSWSNCLYEIVYQILLQGSVMFSGGVDKVIYDLSGNLIDLISILMEINANIFW